MSANWGKQYDRPSFWDRVLAFLLRFVPPIGPLKALRFKTPTPQVEQLFMRSFDLATTAYRGKLNSVHTGALRLENTNFDLGVAAPPGHYKLQDDTYAYWLDALAQENFAGVTPAHHPGVAQILRKPERTAALEEPQKRLEAAFGPARQA